MPRKPTPTQVLRWLIPTLKHVDEEYKGDHWATGNCPRCLAEISLGLRNPEVGGATIKENKKLIRALRGTKEFKNDSQFIPLN